MPIYDFVDLDAQPALVRTVSCAHAELGPTITKVMEEMIASNGDAELIAPPMVVYTDWREDSCDIEIALPVDAQTTPAGGCELRTYPACTAVHMAYNGAYDGLMQAWSDLWAAVVTDNVEVGGHPWDSYAIGPQDTDDPSQWVTDLYIPMTKS